MISYAEQELLETIVKNTSRSLQDIYTVLGKVYDDELALDLNIPVSYTHLDVYKRQDVHLAARMPETFLNSVCTEK